MPETKKDPVHTLTDEDIVSTPLTRRSLLAQTGLVLGLAGAAAIGTAPTTAKAQTVDEDDDDAEPGAPEADDDASDP